MTDEVEITREGAVLSAALARPQKKNAITSAMYEALIDVFEKAERDASVGALVLSGKGGVFTAGNDIGDFLAIATGAAGSPDARFSMPFVNLGLVPEAGSSLLAPERFGRARAAEFLLLAEPFDAARALALGLVNEVLPEAELLTHAISKAAVLAAKPRSALLATRRLLRGDPEALKARMAEEIQAFSAALASSEARAAFMAFMAGAKA